MTGHCGLIGKCEQPCLAEPAVVLWALHDGNRLYKIAFSYIRVRGMQDACSPQVSGMEASVLIGMPPLVNLVA